MRLVHIRPSPGEIGMSIIKKFAAVFPAGGDAQMSGGTPVLVRRKVLRYGPGFQSCWTFWVIAFVLTDTIEHTAKISHSVATRGAFHAHVDTGPLLSYL